MRASKIPRPIVVLLVVDSASEGLRYELRRVRKKPAGLERTPCTIRGTFVRLESQLRLSLFAARLLPSGIMDRFDFAGEYKSRPVISLGKASNFGRDLLLLRATEERELRKLDKQRANAASKIQVCSEHH